MDKDINGLDIIDLLSLLGRKKKTFLKLMMNDLELILEKDSPEFVKVKKLIFDYFNDFNRSIMRVLVGEDVETNYVRQRPDIPKQS